MVDNSLIFSDMRSELFSGMTRYDDLKNVRKIDCLNKDNLYLDMNLHNLEYFLETSDRKFIEIIKEMFLKASPIIIKEVIEGVEKAYNYKLPDKEKMLAMYSKNYEAIKELLESRGILHGPRIH